MPSGFLPHFINDDYRSGNTQQSDQVHHAAFYITLGFVLSGTFGESIAMAMISEFAQASDRGHPNDIALGVEAARIGVDYASRLAMPHSRGDAGINLARDIRQKLCGRTN
jgi:hypothetical protein